MDLRTAGHIYRWNTYKLWFWRQEWNINMLLRIQFFLFTSVPPPREWKISLLNESRGDVLLARLSQVATQHFRISATF